MNNFHSVLKRLSHFSKLCQVIWMTPQHRSTAVYFRFQIVNFPTSDFPVLENRGYRRVYAVVWTTTPWTLPLNNAICFSSDTDYALLGYTGEKARHKLEREEAYIVAKDCISRFQLGINEQMEQLGEFPGKLLEGLCYVSPLFRDFSRPFVQGMQVTTEKGSGLVHISFAHGFEDFQMGEKLDERVECLVDEEGCYSRQLGPELSGKCVIEDGCEVALDALRKHVLGREIIVHSYPYDWRSKKPLRNMNLEKGTEILDIWFDSGISWWNVIGKADIEENDGANLVLEGQDQYRGWFQSSLLTSIAIRGKAPYKAILVHGFAVDENGKKMSKSEGNVVDPSEIISGSEAVGVDALRLWVAAYSGHSLIRIGPEIMKKVKQSMKQLRTVLRFILGTTWDFKEDAEKVNYASLSYQTDRYALHLLYEYLQAMTEAYECYDFNRAINLAMNFVNGSLSNFYCTVVKDRLYCDLATSLSRKSAQTVLNEMGKGIIIHKFTYTVLDTFGIILKLRDTLSQAVDM